ncbi:hypothetical protein B0H10DRAFT_1111168 [Mycena sp. CBHHK59/15]|nr:hypothetical protein B0H10DRAFT_1111168 [Mycena sp. CBHHK59/15]
MSRRWLAGWPCGHVVIRVVCVSGVEVCGVCQGEHGGGSGGAVAQRAYIYRKSALYCASDRLIGSARATAQNTAVVICTRGLHIGCDCDCLGAAFHRNQEPDLRCAGRRGPKRKCLSMLTSSFPEKGYNKVVQIFAHRTLECATSTQRHVPIISPSIVRVTFPHANIPYTPRPRRSNNIKRRHLCAGINSRPLDVKR